jgi:hypothetical protein
MSYTPSAEPLPEGWIDAIWRATKAGALTWPEACHLQVAFGPRCLKHDQPIKSTDNGGQCLRCVEESLGAEHE